MRQRVIINWGISSFYGWGVYGLNLALQWVNDADIEPMCSIPIGADDIVVDPIRRRALSPFLGLSTSLQGRLLTVAGPDRRVECPVLTFVDLKPNGFSHMIAGEPTIGVVFFETAKLDAEAIALARSFPLIVTGSSWNRRILNEYGLDNVVTILQGIDPTLFHPAPAGRWLGNRFCVFSGGKLEYRKAQDIVLAAFRIFSKRHEEALLVSAWHSPWQGVARTLDVSALVSPVPFDATGAVDVPGWALANDIRPEQVLDLGAIPNSQMPALLREMDVAVFPNRCEGGTNLVAMECMASGIPVILSRNTGHVDLIGKANCFALDQQTALDGDRAGVGPVPGWGESDVHEVVDNLERVFTDRTEAKRRALQGAETMKALSWTHTAARLKSVILEQGS